MLKHSTTAPATAPAAGTTVGGNQWNADHVIDAGGLVMPTSVSSAIPSAPAAGNATIYGRTLAGREMLGVSDSNGLNSIVQPFFGRNRVMMWSAAGNAGGNVTVFGASTPSTSGAATTRNVATTNLLTSMRRMGMISAATAGSIAALRGAAQFFRGDAAGKGGFMMTARWGCSDAAAVAGARTFVGLSQFNITNVDVSTATSIIGVGTDSADSNLYLMHNDGSGTANKIALGPNFPDHTLSADAYELTLFCPPNVNWVNWEVVRLNTGDVARGQITTKLPAATTLLIPQFNRNNGPTALAVGIDIMSLYIETDN